MQKRKMCSCSAHSSGMKNKQSSDGLKEQRTATVVAPEANFQAGTSTLFWCWGFQMLLFFFRFRVDIFSLKGKDPLYEDPM